MNSGDTARRFPQTEAEWAEAIARAPERVMYDPETDCYDPNDPKAVDEFWDKTEMVVTYGGGYAAVRKAWAEKRLRDQLNPLLDAGSIKCCPPPSPPFVQKGKVLHFYQV